jgi:hypothetical protein
MTPVRNEVKWFLRLSLILSKHPLCSGWVRTEIANARKREVKEGKRVLFPVRLVGFETLRNWECFDADTGKDSAREIRELFIPDREAAKRAFESFLSNKALSANQIELVSMVIDHLISLTARERYNSQPSPV